MGTLYWLVPGEKREIEAGETWRRVACARGTVRVPADRFLRLVVSDEGARDLSPLARLPADGLQGLYVWSHVGDELLAPLRGLTGLRSLYLGGSRFTDAGLAFLSGMKDLEDVTLDQTQAGDETAARLAALPRLRSLAVGTRTTDAGMKHIGRMSGLESLSLSSADVTDLGLAEISRLTNLKLLQLYWLPITNAGVRHLSNLANLEYLSLDETLVTRACLPDLARLTKLRHLHLDGIEHADEVMEQLSRLPALEHASVDRTATDRSLEALGRIPTLKCLNLEGTFTDAGLEHLARLPHLHELNFQAEQGISREGCRAIAKLPSLKRLWLQNCQIDDEGLRCLNGLPLEMLLLNNNGITWEGLDALEQFSGLKELQLTTNPQGTPTLRFLRRLPELTTLRIQNAFCHDADFAPEEWSHLAAARRLEDLSIALPIHDAALRHLAELRHLEHLELVGPITDEGLKHLQGLTGLRELRIHGETTVTDSGLEHLAAMHSLEQLQIDSPRLTKSGIAEFVRRRPRLTQFNTPLDEPGPGWQDMDVSMLGRPASELALTTLDGSPFHLSDHRGKLVVIHFWWPNCAESLGELKTLHAEFDKRSDIEFVSIALAEDDRAIRDLVERHALRWRHALVDPERQAAVAFRRVNCRSDYYFVVDRAGRIIATPKRHEFDDLRKVLGIELRD